MDLEACLRDTVERPAAFGAIYLSDEEYDAVTEEARDVCEREHGVRFPPTMRVLVNWVNIFRVSERGHEEDISRSPRLLVLGTP